MGRRAKGEGLVYQRKDGRYCGKYVDETTGTTRYVYGKNKTDVRAKLKQAMKASEEGIVTANITFGEYLNQWLESVRDAVGVRTYRRSEETVRLHIKPRVGRIKLDKLTTLQLDALYREKLAEGLSSRSVQIIHATAHKALKQAAKWRMVRENVAEHATPPRSVKKETNVLTKEQVQILLNTAKRNQPNLYALYALATTTGARLGELLALQPSDVDMDLGTLRIARSVHNGCVSQPKTRAGCRTIMLARIALDALHEHLDKYAGDTWLFPSPVYSDTSIHRSTLHITYWKPLLKKAGLPQEIRFHDLRHSAASLLIAEGVPVPVVSQLLGHADSSITLRVYAHLLKDQQGTAALAMNGLLEEPDRTPSPAETL